MKLTMRNVTGLMFVALSVLLAGCSNVCSSQPALPLLGYPGMSGDEKRCEQSLLLTAEAIGIAQTTTAPITPTVVIPAPSLVHGTGNFPQFPILAQNIGSGYSTLYLVNGASAVPITRVPTSETMGRESQTSLSPNGRLFAVLTEDVSGTTTLSVGENPNREPPGILIPIDKALFSDEKRITGFTWTNGNSLVYSIARITEGNDEGTLLEYDHGRAVRSIASGRFYRVIGLSGDAQRAFVTRRRWSSTGWPTEEWALIDLATGSLNDFDIAGVDKRLSYFDFAAFALPGIGPRLLTVVSETEAGTTILSPATSIMLIDPDTASSQSWAVPASHDPLLYVGRFVWHQETQGEFAFVVNSSLYSATTNQGTRPIATLEGSLPILWTSEGIVLWNQATLNLQLIDTEGAPIGGMTLN